MWLEGNGERRRNGSEGTHRQRSERAHGVWGSQTQHAADVVCLDMSGWELVVTGDSRLKLGYGRTSLNNNFRNLGGRR